MIQLLRGSTNYIRANVVDETGAQLGGGDVRITLYDSSSGAKIVDNAQMIAVLGQAGYNYQYATDPTIMVIDLGTKYWGEVIATIGAVVIRKRETVEVYE